MTNKQVPDEVVKQLAALFHRNGYVRPPAERRLSDDRPVRRGYEFRLTAESRGELRLIRDLLRRAGFKAGRPFVKGLQFRQPVYGAAQLKRFLALIGEPDA